MSNTTTQSRERSSRGLAFDAANTKMFVELRKVQERAEATKSAARTRSLDARAEDLKNDITRYNTGLVLNYVKKFMLQGGQYDDIVQAGMVGLAIAIDKYDPDLGPFGAYAYRPIKREVIRCVRATEHSHLSLGDFERRQDILSVAGSLVEPGASITAAPVAQVAAVAGVSEGRVARVLHRKSARSLQEVLTADSNGFGLQDTLEDTAVADPGDSYVTNTRISALLEFGLPLLDHREKFVLCHYTGIGGAPQRNFEAIGQALSGEGTKGLTREAVRQIYARAVSKLQHPRVLKHVHEATARA